MLSDLDVLTIAFQLHGDTYLEDLKDSVIDRIINFLKYQIIEMPENSNQTIAEYLIENGEADSMGEVCDYVRGVEEDSFANAGGQEQLSYLIYGDGYLISM